MTESNLRMSVLHIDRDADLPLMYRYVPADNAFETVGYVRLRGVMVPRVTHAGPDTDKERDRFLLKVLTSLAVPSRAASRIVHTADHVSGQGPRVDRMPADPGSPWDMGSPWDTESPWDAGSPWDAESPWDAGYGGRDGLHAAGPGMLVGLLCGLVAGWLYAGWNGAVLGAFAGMSTFPDLFVAGWQFTHADVFRSYAEICDALAVLLVGAGTLTGGVLGALLGSPGFGQARGMFLGMALAAFVLALAAVTISRVPFHHRLLIWLGPLIVGAVTWGAYSLWSSPVSLALGVVLGAVVARIPGKWIAESAGYR